MKKVLFTSLSFASMFFLYTDPSLSTVSCDYTGNLTEEKAKTCINNAIKSNINGLYSMANSKSHTGNIADCTTKKNIGSYFPKGRNNFNSVLSGTTVSGDCIYSRKYGGFNCWVTPNADVCYISRGGYGIKGRTEILFAVGGGEIVSFYPAPRRSQ